VLTIGIAIFEDAEELDFVGPFEVFGVAAKLGADCRTVIVGEHKNTTRCRHGLRVMAEYDLSDVPPLDLLIVPGGAGARTRAADHSPIVQFVRAHKGAVASVCTGALILAAAGALAGRAATTHHSAYELLGDYGVPVERGTRFVVAGPTATSAGVTAGIDLALALVARYWGDAIAEGVAEEIEWGASNWRTAASRE